VGTIYRPPNQSDFLEHFEDTMTKINPERETFIFGDFNICLLNKLSALCKRYQNILNRFNFKQLINVPTRVTQTSSTLIDHLISNSEDRVSQSGVLQLGLGDHFLIHFTRKIVRQSVNQESIVKIRSMKTYYKDDFTDKLNNANWSDVYLCTNVNNAWRIFQEICMSILDDIAPTKEIKIKQKNRTMDNI